MTKQEILNKKLFYNKGITFNEFESGLIYEMMDEFAKQASVEFCLKVVSELILPKTMGGEQFILSPNTIFKLYDLYFKLKK